ncbi:MAG: sugar phosphate nucleotidyltransferase [Acidobacteriota bacterium]
MASTVVTSFSPAVSDATEVGRLLPIRRFKDERWAVILAGGEGQRLRSMTRVISGDDRPKQFCSLVGRGTLLQQTEQRVGVLVPPARTIVVVTSGQERFLDPTNQPGSSVIVQPSNRGTAAAILYGLFSMRDFDAPVALFPADHYMTDYARFMEHVEVAYRAVEEVPSRVILLGVNATTPEPDYGWIRPGAVAAKVSNESLFQVGEFIEKPTPSVARELWHQHCLWNSFVFVGRAHTLLSLVREAEPAFYEIFEDAWTAMASEDESRILSAFYDYLPSVDFSRQVLARCPERLLVMPVANSGWTDLGRPERVLELLDRRASYRTAYL